MGDIEIARSVKLNRIEEIAKRAGIDEENLELYGKYKAKITEEEIKTAMDLVVSKNIFAPGGSDIFKSVSAKVVVTDTTGYDLVI